MKLIPLSLIFLASLHASAEGNLASSCDIAKQIRNPVGGQGVVMSRDCKTAYVLPPESGKASVNGRTVGDLSRCKEATTLTRGLRDLAQKMKEAAQNPDAEQSLAELTKSRKALLDSYKDVVSAPGAAVELSFSMNVGALVAKYQEQNEGLPVSFQAVQLRDVKIAWNSAKTEDPEFKFARNQAVPIEGDPGKGAFSARLELTLYGACQLRSPFSNKFPDQLNFEEVAGLITPNITYKYETNATMTYVAQYNRGALAKAVQKSGTSGGFFRTSSARSMIEKSESQSWFLFDGKCDDSRICEQAKAETAIEIKQRLMNEVLEGITLAKLGIPVTPIDVAPPGETGSAAAAKALRSTCAKNSYCQAGALILDVAGATFGGTSKTENYIRTNDHWAKEEVTHSQPVSFTGIMNFKGG